MNDSEVFTQINQVRREAQQHCESALYCKVGQAYRARAKNLC